MLIADGNGPEVTEIEVSTTPVAVSTSAAVVSITPTPEPKGWLNGTTVFWGVVVVLAITAVVYWIKNKKK